ncbi:unnamed protein product [Rotaria sordida]|uniref:Uncharacterized protein n=1 Tax=Rotaria sordida TaxID=392033 RepID=A0A815DRY0_9BILA|nr:unnamed protein product [Rotaria sordida]CAF1575138.1 unnamed protein product [Rotaria sordida]
MEIYVPEEHIIEMENNQSLINEQEDIELIDKSLNIQLMEFEKSQREVAQIIEMTQPDIVMVELCQSRINILSLNENTLMKEASQLNFEKLRSVIKAVIYIYLIYRNIPSDKINGVIHGIIHVLLLRMAPEGELRTAFREAQKVPGCNLVLGDRLVGITLK